MAAARSWPLAPPPLLSSETRGVMCLPSPPWTLSLSLSLSLSELCGGLGHSATAPDAALDSLLLASVSEVGGSRGPRVLRSACGAPSPDPWFVPCYLTARRLVSGRSPKFVSDCATCSRVLTVPLFYALPPPFSCAHGILFGPAAQKCLGPRSVA